MELTRHRVPGMEGIDEAKSPVEQLVLVHVSPVNCKL